MYMSIILYCNCTFIFHYWLVRSNLQEKEEVILELVSNLKSITLTSPVNSGRPIDVVQERQRRRKISTLKEASKKALWFADSFNLDLVSIILKTRNTQEVLSLEYSSQSHLNQLVHRHNLPLINLPRLMRYCIC